MLDYCQQNSHLQPDVWFEHLSQCYTTIKNVDVHEIQQEVITTVNDKYLNCSQIPNIVREHPVWIIISRCLLQLDRDGRLPWLGCTRLDINTDIYVDTWSPIFGLPLNELPSNVIIAGGNPANHIFGRSMETINECEDIDLWIIGLNSNVRKQALAACLEWISTHLGRCLYTVKYSCITITSAEIYKARMPNIQVIYTNYINPAQLIASFDLPMIQCFFDGRQFFGTYELIQGRLTNNYKISATNIDNNRKHKLHRYAGLTYDISNWSNNFTYNPNHDCWNIDKEQKTCTLTIPSNITSDRDEVDICKSSRQLCSELYDSMSSVYNKYYRFDCAQSDERNMYMAKNILQSLYETFNWSEVLSEVSYDFNMSSYINDIEYHRYDEDDEDILLTPDNQIVYVVWPRDESFAQKWAIKWMLKSVKENIWFNTPIQAEDRVILYRQHSSIHLLLPNIQSSNESSGKSPFHLQVDPFQVLDRLAYNECRLQLVFTTNENMVSPLNELVKNIYKLIFDEITDDTICPSESKNLSTFVNEQEWMCNLKGYYPHRDISSKFISSVRINFGRVVISHDTFIVPEYSFMQASQSEITHLSEVTKFTEYPWSHVMIDKDTAKENVSLKQCLPSKVVKSEPTLSLVDSDDECSRLD